MAGSARAPLPEFGVRVGYTAPRSCHAWKRNLSTRYCAGDVTGERGEEAVSLHGNEQVARRSASSRCQAKAAVTSPCEPRCRREQEAPPGTPGRSLLSSA